MVGGGQTLSMRYHCTPSNMSVRYLQVVITLRRFFCVAIVISFARYGPSTQLLFMLLVLAIALFLHLKSKPFVHWTIQKVETASLVTSMVTLFILLDHTLDHTLDSPLTPFMRSSLIYLVNGMFWMYWLHALVCVVNPIYAYSDKHPDGFMKRLTQRLYTALCPTWRVIVFLFALSAVCSGCC